VAETVKYDPSIQDFSSYVTLLSNNLDAVLDQYPPEKTGIYLVSFSEGTDILNIASMQNSLGMVNWYGSSAFAESKSLLTDTEAADFAISQNFSCPVFGLDDNAKDRWLPLSAALESELGRKPEVYALVAYDAAWLLTYTYLINTGDITDIRNLKVAFTENANNHYGVTGWTGLNDAGDRAYATYDFFGIEKEGESYSWVRTAKFNNASGVLVRY
jgi:branched-chain amino acid transport system substrate-binding protein